MKKHLLFAAAIMMAVGSLTACGTAASDAATDNETTSSESSEISKSLHVEATEVEDVTETETAGYGEVDPEEAAWREAYTDYISNTDTPDSDGYGYAVIYLDDNDVPEIFVSTGSEAGGEYVMTYYDGEVVVEQLSRLGTGYVERSGFLYTNTGHMDYYPVSITMLSNGTFDAVAEGLGYLSDETRQALEDGTGVYELTYQWGDEEVTEDQFNENIAAFVDVDAVEYPDTYLTQSDILELLKEY